jgi:hypothetical protein
MVVTEAVFQLRMFWVNDVAESNILAMLVADAVFHALMLLLKVPLDKKSADMLVTRLVSQSPIGPYVVVAVVGLVTHAVTAVPMLPSVMHKAHVTEPAVHA